MDKRLKRSVRLSVILYWIYFSSQAEGACSWPAVFGSTQWHDSSRGDINFGGTSMTGWSFSPTTNVIVSEWECLSVDTFDTDGRMLLLTTNSFSIFNTDLYAYMCITLIKVTESSYRYYMNCPIKTNVNNERLFVYNVNTLTDVNTICCNSSVTSGSEYQMLIRAGSESSAKVNCPWEILGSYGYTHTTVTGTVTCDSSPSQMDMCANSTQMTFNHGTCATKVTYSNSNTVWCVDNVPVGDANFVMVYNGNDDTADIDGSTIYSFTCIAVSSTGDKASVSPENCQDGQSPDQFPVNPSGVTIGAKLALSVTASCPTCPVLSNPNRATVSISSNGAVTTAVYTCEGNYSLTGESTRTCQANKTWSGSEPFCNCASPASIGNGTLTLNSNGTVATYTCDVGFTLDGLATRTCQIATATWEDVDPVCVNCESLVDGSGRSYTLSTDGTVTTAFYTCAQKYSLSGATSLICASTGTWDQDQPTCVSCGFLTNPHSGSVTITTNGSTSTATYACSTGYTRVGSETRTCQLSGVWDNSQPTCQCDSPSSPDNGALIADGATATYTCKTNYSLSGDASRSCQEDSSGWSGSDPSCSLCDTLSTVTGGSVALSTTGTVTSATYTCTIGYSLNGSTPITCSSTGSWDTASPTCVMCPTLANPSSGTATLSTTGTQTSASYACASGYDLNDSNGNTIRVCNSDGSWSLTSPTCTCQSPSGITHGSVKEDGVTANYTCDQGYSLNGVSTRTCDSNGNGWSGSDPSCATCDTLTAQTGGTVTIATDGQSTQASFTCDSGYTLNGQTPITCRSSDGTWDFTQPNCAKCPDLTAPSGGSFTMTTTGTVTSASFACGSAYYISGAYLLTCQTDGSWDHSEPTCKCNFPSTPTNGGVSVSDGSTGTFATYSCDTGYSLSGLVTRACQTDNTGWEGSDPTCVICQIVTVPASGTLSLSTSGTQTIVTYSCDQGTSLNGDTTLVCQSDGTFDKTIPTCVDCPTLSNPSSGSVSLTTDGTVTTGTFSCLSGYTLTSTSSVLTCLTSGAWDITAPSCVCESPPLVANGELVLSSDLSTVTYTCDTGYVLVGSQSRTCSEIGTGWDGIAPSCDIEATVAPSTEESSSDSSLLTVHMAVIICVGLVALFLAVLLAIVFYFYCVLRRKDTRIASKPTDPEISPAIAESAVETSAKPSGIDINRPWSRTGRATPLSKEINSESPTTSKTSASDVLVNGPVPSVDIRTSSKLPLKSVRLPRLKQQPPASTSHNYSDKLKKKKVADRKLTIKEVNREPRAKTPTQQRTYDMGLARGMTPELLSQMEFNYIHPIHCYDGDTPIPESGRTTRATSVLSRKGKRIKKGNK